MRKYDTYKDSGIEWIGEIPSHWDTARMKFHLDYQKGKNPKELKFSENENSEVYLAMDYLRGNPKQMLYVEDFENYVKVADNEILLLWDGSNAGEFVLSKKGILSSTMAVLSLNNIQKDFSWYFFKHFEPQLKESTIGMGVPHVNGEELKNGFIVLPTPNEQTAIAAYLDRKTAEIDELIADKKRLLELYEEEKTAIINQAVTKGINPDAPMKDSGIEWLGEIPEHWVVKRFKHVSTKIGDGIHTTPSYLQGTEIYFINGVNLNNGKITLTDKTLSVPIEEYDKFKTDLKQGSILISLNGTIGKLAFYNNEKVILGKSAAYIELEDIVFNKFIYYILKSQYIHNYFEDSFSGTTIKNLSLYTLRNTPFPYMKLEEQQSIVRHIETECAHIDAKKAKTEKLIELLTEYRTALISEVVTGKIKIIE